MEVLGGTSSQINVQVGEKTATVYAEMLMPSAGLPDWLVYDTGLTHWDPPFDREAIEESEQKKIIQGVCKYLEKIGRIPKVVS